MNDGSNFGPGTNDCAVCLSTTHTTESLYGNGLRGWLAERKLKDALRGR